MQLAIATFRSGDGASGTSASTYLSNRLKTTQLKLTNQNAQQSVCSAPCMKRSSLGGQLCDYAQQVLMRNLQAKRAAVILMDCCAARQAKYDHGILEAHLWPVLLQEEKLRISQLEHQEVAQPHSAVWWQKLVASKRSVCKDPTGVPRRFVSGHLGPGCHR